MKIVASAPGKMILIGEYAVLEGAPSLVMAVDRRARVTLRPAHTGSFSVSSPTLGIPPLDFILTRDRRIKFREPLTESRQSALRFFVQTFDFFLQKYPGMEPSPPVHIRLETDQFFLPEAGGKLGIGSSAALTVALLAGLFRFYLGRPPGSDALFALAREAHHRAQGKSGSGIDIAASVYGGLLNYRLSGTRAQTPQIERRRLPAELILLPVWSGRSASTRGLVAQVHRWKAAHPDRFGQILQEMTGVSGDACRALDRADIGTFLQDCRQYADWLAELGESSGADIMSHSHRQIARLVEGEGAVYKPSGAGGGDLGLALTDSPEIARRVRRKILHSSYQLINLKLSKTGITIADIDNEI